MRLCSFNADGEPDIGIAVAGGYLALSDIDPSLPRDITALLAGGSGMLESLRQRIESAELPPRQIASEDLLPVVPRPGKVLCLGLNYVAHAREGNMEIPTYPVVFLRTRTSLLAPGQAHVMIPQSKALDYEAELAVVIGTGGSRIPVDRALSHVAGYSLFNDLTYRDLQFRGPQWTMGKNVDGTGPLGPVLVTPDELPLGAVGLGVRTRVNGETLQDGNTADMIFDVATTISTLSQLITLEPGDVIVTGTPAGVGAAHKPPKWLVPGDLCEIEIDGIGTLSTRIEAPAV